MKEIFTRRSVRKYTDQPVSADQLDLLLRAAMAAPSAGNEQPWHFVILDDRSVMTRITEVHPYSKMLLQAPVAIVVCGELSREKYPGFWVQDCSAAIENTLLEAQHLGLGAVWLGVHPIADRVKAVHDLLALPENVIPLGIVSVGHPQEMPAPADRFDVTRIHRNKW